MASSEMRNVKQTYIHASSKYKIRGHFCIFAVVCKQENTKILFFILSISMPRDRVILMLYVTVKNTVLWVRMLCCLENA
jgi:hypothetical protein